MTPHSSPLTPHKHGKVAVLMGRAGHGGAQRWGRDGEAAAHDSRVYGGLPRCCR
jgi:hypothetical protein